MTSAELLVDALGRIRGVVHRAVDGLTPEQLAFRLDPETNSIAWLVWHLARVQDDHVADAFGTDQVWVSKGWRDRFDLPLDGSDTGYGHSSQQVDDVRVADGDLLTGYLDDVVEHTRLLVHDLPDGDLDRIVDTSWDPPVRLGVRLTSVVGDDMQHLGQAALLRGVMQDR